MPDSVRIVLFPSEEAAQTNGDFYVVEEADDLGNPKLIGGKLLPNETPDQAILRETEEEAGVQPDEVTIHWATDLENEDGSSKRHIFYGWLKPGVVHRPTGEIATINLFNESTLPRTAKNLGHMTTAAHEVRLIIPTEP